MAERHSTPAPIDRAVVQEAYDSAALTVSRIHSEWRHSNIDNLDLLPYYEGQRDALRRLLEPQTDE